MEPAPLFGGSDGRRNGCVYRRRIEEGCLRLRRDARKCGRVVYGITRIYDLAEQDEVRLRRGPFEAGAASGAGVHGRSL